MGAVIIAGEASTIPSEFAVFTNQWKEGPNGLYEFSGSRYGLKADGSFDNTQRFADAVYEVQKVAGSLILSPGRYVTDKVVLGEVGLRRAMTISGQGWNSDIQDDAALDTKGVVLALINNASGPLFQVLPEQGPFHFEKLLGYGNQAFQSDDTACFIDFVESVTPTRAGTMRDLYFTRFRGGGLNIGMNRNAGQIERVVGLNCGYQPGGSPVTGGKDGIIFASCSDWRITVSDFGGMSRNGIYAVGAGSLEVQNTNSFSNLKHGYRCDQYCGDTRWIGGSLDRNRENGALFIGRDHPERGYKHIIQNTIFVINSYSTDNGFADIRMIDCLGDVIIDHPYFEYSADTPNKVSYNILAEGTTTDIIVSNVHSSGTPSYATAFTNDESRLIRGNASVRCDGFIMSNNATDAVNDISVGPGIALDETRLLQLKTSATIVKQLDVAFAEYTAPGTASGGRDPNDNLTGAKTLHAFMISGFGKLAQPFFSTSLTPTLPTGFTRKRRIGGIYWDGSTIKPFTQDGDEFLWAVPNVDLSAGAWSNAAGLVNHLSLPTGVKVVALLRASFTASSGTKYARIEDPAVTSAVISSGSATLAAVAGSFNSVAGPLRIKTNVTRQTRRISDDASGVGTIVTLGWVDPRGA